MVSSQRSRVKRNHMCSVVETSEEEEKLITISLGHLKGYTNEEIEEPETQ
ncbi:hypothetical protein [Chengkuizengella axinellae]|uniref:Uncharacterized protein n=1 Tax=Chengkuizengella axinellae TaxID=3064388 RepID=A0ABT9IZB0_9BACL|nr:hypothetical protein [Chengkuizengella sp. 2205SS18-9]MDP5274472.1 hypothetical protein [Chengkuizengella sp. 2205SS18-9]